MQKPDCMHVVINGETREVPEKATFAEVLAELGYGNRRIAVERNGEILPRSQHPNTRLNEGDVIEIVQAIGGG